MVVIWRSVRKLSVRACERLERSSSRAMNIMHAQNVIYQSIFRISLSSSRQVHLKLGSNRWIFSLRNFRLAAKSQVVQNEFVLSYQSALGWYFSAVSASSKTLSCHPLSQYSCSKVPIEQSQTWVAMASLSIGDPPLNHDFLSVMGAPRGGEMLSSETVETDDGSFKPLASTVAIVPAVKVERARGKVKVTLTSI